MIQYTSTDNLNEFHFHDCFLVEVKSEDKNSIWILDHIDVEKSNLLNLYNAAMETDMAIITFYDCKYKNLEINYGGSKPRERIANINLFEANKKFSNHYFFSLDQNQKGLVEVCIHFSDHLYIFEVEYNRVTISWNTFVRKSWYESD